MNGRLSLIVLSQMLASLPVRSVYVFFDYWTTLDHSGCDAASCVLATQNQWDA